MGTYSSTGSSSCTIGASVAVFFSVVASAPPTSLQIAELQGIVAQVLNVAESDLVGFTVTAAASRRRLLSGYTWAVSFSLLAARFGQSASTLSSSVMVTLTSAAFQSAVASGVSGVALTVVGSSVTAVESSATPSPPYGSASGSELRSNRSSLSVVVAASVGVVVGLLMLGLAFAELVNHRNRSTRVQDDDFEDSWDVAVGGEDDPDAEAGAMGPLKRAKEALAVASDRLGLHRSARVQAEPQGSDRATPGQHRQAEPGPSMIASNLEALGAVARFLFYRSRNAKVQDYP